MNNYVIFTDAAGDFPKDYCDEKKFVIIPMDVIIDEVTTSYGGDSTEAERSAFYEKIEAGALPTTAQVTTYIFEEEFRSYLAKGEDILYIGFSSGISGTYASSQMAAKNLAQEFPDRKVICIDTIAATSGLALLMKRAIENKDAGMSIEDNASDIESIKQNVQHWFTVNDLFHLKRGGRVSAVQAVIGTALAVKPILTLNTTGKIINVESIRGQKKALMKMVEVFNQNATDATEDIIITSVNNPESAEYVEKLLLETGKVKNVYHSSMSPVIATHTGSGIILLTYFGLANRTD